MRDRQCGVPYYWKRYIVLSRLLCNFKMHLCSSLARFRRLSCVFCCIGRKKASTLRFDRVPKNLFCSNRVFFVRKFCWCSFAHSHIFLQKYSIPQHLCKLLSIWLHFCDDESAAHFPLGHIFMSRTPDDAANWFLSQLFCHQFPFVFPNQLPSSSFIICSVATCASWMAIRRNFQPKYLRLSIKYLIFRRFDHFICFVNDICLCRANSMNYYRHTHTTRFVSLFRDFVSFDLAASCSFYLKFNVTQAICSSHV